MRPMLPFPIAAVVTALGERPGLIRPFPIGVKRRWLDLASSALPFPSGTVIRRVELAGRPGYRVSVGATERPRAIVHLHGGGFVVGSPYAYRSAAAFLAEAAGAVVYLPDYRLAPEHRYPAALDDAVAAIQQVSALHEAVGVSGDSAGGGLAVSATRRLLDGGRDIVCALALASPWVDPMALSEGRKRDLIISEGFGRWAAMQYIGSADPADPGVAPLHGRLGDLPPTLVHVCRTEVLHPQVVHFVQRLRAEGVDVALTEQRLWHAGMAQAGLVAEARDAVTELGEFLRKHAVVR
ncbi:alpha/beta hydrolase [Jatrophihabitans telluris]|uniref:Alpha/beta hydrolase n=1 Tax=Jatrophihabitans telluris TaxID=2038343 RepID=A0ABY4QYA9_9ACTN|nr:alpha/beta hydrolase fold domain-containing protein [Jatrophihabitans telluris]UQX88508.1 alpha/beta hydrolase [Jatrophihabitans telluris]